jgi:hypothetical protein
MYWIKPSQPFCRSYLRCYRPPTLGVSCGRLVSLIQRKKQTRWIWMLRPIPHGWVRGWSPWLVFNFEIHLSYSVEGGGRGVEGVKPWTPGVTNRQGRKVCYGLKAHHTLGFKMGLWLSCLSLVCAILWIYRFFHVHRLWLQRCGNGCKRYSLKNLF